jgi:L-fuconolactonase
MRIDAHQHFWIYSKEEYGWISDTMSILKRDFLPDDLVKELKENKFDGSIAVQARQTLQETEWLINLAEQNEFIKGVVGWLDIQSPQFKHQIEKYSRRNKLVGIRHVVQDEPDDRFMLRSEFVNGMRLLENYDLVYDILIFEKQLPATLELVSRFPNQRFVLDHIGKPKIAYTIVEPWKSLISELAQYPEVYCKVSGMVTEADWQYWKKEDLLPYLDTIFDSFGPDRILFGSDWPVCTLAAPYKQVTEIVFDYIKQFPNEDRNKVLGINANKVYNLKYSDL